MKGSGRLRLLGGTVVCATAGLALTAAPAFGASTLTYNPSPFGTSLNVTGEADDDLISISTDGTTVTIADSGTGGISTADADCANAGGVAVTCPLDPPDPAPPADPTSPLSFMSASLQGANDTFVSSVPAVQISVSAGDGDDIITGGPDIDSFDGGNGNDQIFGGDGNDSMSGGGTPFTTGGTDLLDGQGGFDSGSFSNREPPVNVSLNGLADDGFPDEGDNLIAERVNGGSGNDTLTGNAEGNLLDGNDGNDILSGLEGNDFLDGDRGDDALIGGPQRDQLECDENFDTGILDPRDVFDAECERTGAEVEGGTASVNKKSKTKVEVNCPVEEANPCAGSLALFAGAKSLGSATFSVDAGLTGIAELKLNKDGRKLLDKNGGTLLARAEAQTTEPVGTSVKEDEVLLRRKPGKSGGK